MKFKCKVCGYIYDEIMEIIPFGELSDDWTCPICGADKDSFEKVEE